MIESLNSPHIARVKALIGSKGSKERRTSARFVAEGLQCAREALASENGPRIDVVYLTQSGRNKLESDFDLTLINTIDVTDEVMKSMSETVTPQGILALCKIPHNSFQSLPLNGRRKFIYLSEIQDPGNAGTIIRSADAFGFDAVITSPGSVDIYSPKVVRSTAGSLWHVNVFEDVELNDLLKLDIQAFALGAQAATSLSDFAITKDCVAIFGNEARGLSTQQSIGGIELVKIEMPGNAESLNLSAAATIVMYHLANIPTSKTLSR